MHRHLFPLILPLIFTILIFISIHIPTSSCADNEKYTNCSNSYKCGKLDITYPFWGAANRPEYCGDPGFEVACQSDVLTITISTISYRVLSTDNSTRTLTVVRQDYWDTYCPTSTSSLVNSSLDSKNIFSYGSTSQNLSLNYGCSSAISGLTIANNQQYICDINTGNTAGYYATRELSASEWAIANSLGSCSNSIRVSVSESAITTLNTSPTLLNLVAAIDGGFGLDWSANNSLCNGCDGSGGQCGRDVTSGQFTCYCTNGPVASKCVSNNSPGSGSSTGLNSIIIGVSAAFAGIVVVFIMICCLRTKSVSDKMLIFRKNDQDVDAFLRNHGSLAPKKYIYSDVKKMTNSFIDKLGQGGYGCVYKGKLSDGRLVAVKVLSESKGNGKNF